MSNEIIFESMCDMNNHTQTYDEIVKFLCSISPNNWIQLIDGIVDDYDKRSALQDKLNKVLSSPQINKTERQKISQKKSRLCFVYKKER